MIRKSQIVYYFVDVVVDCVVKLNIFLDGLDVSIEEEVEVVNCIF